LAGRKGKRVKVKQINKKTNKISKGSGNVRPVPHINSVIVTLFFTSAKINKINK
jgi:hypothetical protein